jgi:hypothetical protein
MSSLYVKYQQFWPAHVAVIIFVVDYWFIYFFKNGWYYRSRPVCLNRGRGTATVKKCRLIVLQVFSKSQRFLDCLLYSLLSNFFGLQQIKDGLKKNPVPFFALGLHSYYNFLKPVSF